jgi:probable rRNA maturation factor
MFSGDTTVLYRGVPAKSKLAPSEKLSLTNFAQALTREVVESRSFTCLITNDNELRTLNKQFLGHDYPTDVLSFPSGDASIVLGELAISIQRAEAQALEFGHSRVDELRVLMLHGLLHLTGMDHERDSGEMARAEKKWHVRFSLPRPLISRTRALGVQA